MKSLFEESTRAEIVERLDRLSPESQREWGKMSPSQAIEHLRRAVDMASGKKPVKQLFIGKVLSWAFRKEFLGEQPFKQGRPTGKAFIVEDDPDFEVTRDGLRASINEFCGLGEAGTEGNVHGFFGPLTGKQWGETQYKHLDHHLRQFGV